MEMDFTTPPDPEWDVSFNREDRRVHLCTMRWASMEGALQELATLGTMREITVQFHHETLPRVRDWLKYPSLVRFAFMDAREFHEFTGLSAKSIHTLSDVPGCLGETALGACRSHGG